MMHIVNEKIRRLAATDRPDWIKEKQLIGWATKIARVASLRPPIVGHDAHWKQSGMKRTDGPHPDTLAGKSKV